MKTISIILIAILFEINNADAQWTKVNAIPTQNIVALATFGDTLLAAGRINVIYKSADGGATWDSIVMNVSPDTIVSLRIIDNKIYVGTNSQGIFISDDFGATWPNTGAGLFAVSGFEKFGNDVYAAMLGNGVYIFNQAINNWTPFNNSLPSYSVNVFTITSSPHSLLIGPGANGTFYRYDFTLNEWIEEYYDGILHPGVKIDRLISNSDTLFAVSGNRIIRSEDDGLNWVNDALDTHDGAYRNISTGINKHYTITNLLSGGTWIQEREKSSVAGASWANNEDFFPTGFSYEIVEFHDKLFLAKGDGLYTKDLTQGISNPENNYSNVKIWSDPSNSSVLNITSNNQINKFTIISILGKVLSSENINKREFTTQQHLSPGIYFISLTFANNQIETKKIIIE